MSKFIVGDKVKVREWSDMEGQYGSFEVGDRTILHTLCIEMARVLPICGRSWHIKEVINNPLFGDTLYILSDGSDYMIPEDALIEFGSGEEIKDGYPYEERDS